VWGKRLYWVGYGLFSQGAEEDQKEIENLTAFYTNSNWLRKFFLFSNADSGFEIR
jgi:hypothetical protein